MQAYTTETIYSLATAHVPAALAVFRLSGAQSDDILYALTQKTLPAFRYACLRQVIHPVSHETIDEAIVIRFAAGASYTGESAVEITVHGGLAIIAAMEEAFEAAGARLAKPGEYTRRAVLNQQMDLTQAEAVAELIAAETKTAHRRALRVLDGEIGAQVQGWRADLIQACALCETSVDFAEEALGSEIEQSGLFLLQKVKTDMQQHLQNNSLAHAADHQPTLALIGPPNAGKSSLLNIVAQRDVAIVTPIAGTTRDALSVELLVSDRRVTLVDTAGLRLTDDFIEEQGVARAEKWAQKADRRILLISDDTWAALTAVDKKRFAEILEDGDDILLSKGDQGQDCFQEVRAYFDRPVTVVSTRDSTASKALNGIIQNLIVDIGDTFSSIATSPRRSAAVSSAEKHLQAAEQALVSEMSEVAIASVQLALRDLEDLMGQVDHEDVLDQVFSRFCIGK